MVVTDKVWRGPCQLHDHRKLSTPDGKRPLRHGRLGGTQLDDVLAATVPDGNLDLVALLRIDMCISMFMVPSPVGSMEEVLTYGQHHVFDHLGIHLSQIGTPTLQTVGFSAGLLTARIEDFNVTRILINMLLSMSCAAQPVMTAVI